MLALHPSAIISWDVRQMIWSPSRLFCLPGGVRRKRQTRPLPISNLAGNKLEFRSLWRHGSHSVLSLVEEFES
jgi:hypothetical protein